MQEYINEELVKPKVWVEVVNAMFENAGKDIKKESLSSMIATLYPDRIKKLIEFWASNDSAKFVAYQPSDDELLKEENKEKVCNQLAEYVINNLIK